MNGPSGVGKTETSRELASRIPQSSLLWLDAIRNTVPEENFHHNGIVDSMARMGHANAIAREIAETELLQGNTVIVDGVKFRSEWIEPWEDLGRKVGAAVLDVCLIAPKPVVEARALNRGYKPGSRLTPEKVSNYFDWITELYQDRPDALVVNTEHLSVVETADVVMANINRVS